MTARLVVPLAAVVLLGAGTATAQGRPARSTDYLFVATVEDARAAWVNPAGLGIVPEASVMAEFVVHRPLVGGAHLGQWGAGFNSRGIAFAYQRDRFPGEPSSDAFRFGVGLRLRRGAIGTSYTLYRSDSTEAGLDFGLRYELTRTLDAGFVLRQVGRPVVRGVKLPLHVTAGLGWVALRRVLELSGEAHAFEDLADSGWDIAYRAGAYLSTPGEFPVGVMAALALRSGFALERFSIGIAVGRADRAVFLTSADRTAGATRLEDFSLTGIASRRVPGVRP